MNATGMEKELLDLENRFWRAIKDKDEATMMALSDDPTFLAGASGVWSIPREAFKGMMARANYTLDRFSLTGDVKVRLLTDDVALVAYTVLEELTVEGKPVTLEAADSSVWVKRDGGWVCSLHTESIAGDSFGRDKVKKG